MHVENDVLHVENDVLHVENDEIDKPNNFEKININVEPFKIEEFPIYDIRQKTKNKKKNINSTRKMPFVFDKIHQLDKDSGVSSYDVSSEKKVTKSIKDFKFELISDESESEIEEIDDDIDEDFEFVDGDYNPIIDKYNASETMSFIQLCKSHLLKKGRTDIIDKCFEKYNSFVKTDMTMKAYAKDLIQHILQL